MKIKSIIIGIALGLMHTLGAQDFLTEYQHFFKGLHLNTPNAPKIIELASPQTNFDMFNGATTGQPQTTKEAEELCRSLSHTQRATTTKVPSWDSLLQWSKPYLEKGIMPLVLIDFRYEKLSDSFWMRQNYDYDSDSNYMVKKGPWLQTDFQSHDAFCFMPMFTQINRNIHSVILDPRFYISHRDIKTIKSLGMDINGQSFTLAPNQPTPFRHLAEGLNNALMFIEVDSTDERVSMNRGIQMQLGAALKRLVTRVHLYFSAKAPEWETITQGLPIDQFDVKAYVSNEARAVVTSGAKVSIHYSTRTQGVPGCLNKPIVFVEGIDFGYRGWPTGYREGKCGNMGYIDLLKGKQWDVESQTWTDWNSIQHTPKILKQYRDSGYDIVYVDFWDGADYLENNAVVVKEVIKQIQQRLCGDHIHVVGASMGALVARRALTMLENDTLSHCVRSYTSFDGPLMGAAIPLSVQVTLDYYSGLSGRLNDLKERMLNRPASKQMLLMHYQNGDKPHALHNKYMADSSMHAFPTIPWRFAVTNGDGEMFNQPTNRFRSLQVGDSLLHFNIGQPLYDFIRNYAIKKGSKTLYAIAKGLPQSDAKLFVFANGFMVPPPGLPTVALFKTTYKKMHSHSVNGDLPSYEHIAGGGTTIIADLHKTLEKHTWLVFSERTTDVTCFIPIWSALASDSVRIKFNKPLSQTLGTQMLGLRNTPFHNYFAPRFNQDHVFFDDEKGGNAEWLLKQIIWSEKQSYQTDKNEIVIGNPYDRFVGSIMVEAGQTLNVNGNLSNSRCTPVEKAVLAKLKSRTFYLGNCQPSEIRIKSGGVMNIESGEAKNHTTLFQCRAASKITVQAGGILKLTGGKSTLHMTQGTQLILEDGATLIVEDGSSLIIDPKSTVWLGKNVTLQLNGTNALMHVKGHLMLEENCNFQITSAPNQAVGLLKLSNMSGGFGNCYITGDGHATFKIRGNDANACTNLQIEGPIDFNNLFDTILVNRSNVKFGNNSQWRVSGIVQINNSEFAPTDWSKMAQNGLHMSCGTLQVKGSKFHHLNTGVQTSENTKTQLQQCAFEQCTTGVLAPSTEFNIVNSTFKKNTVGIEVHGADNHDSISLCNFTANTTGVSINGNSKSAPLHLLENTFYSNTTGIETVNRTIALRCNIFGYNVTGIRATESTVVAGANSKILGEIDTLNCGNNTFAYSEKRSVELNLSKPFFDGENNFLCPSQGNADSKIQIAGTIPNLNSTPWNTKNTVLQLGKNHWFPLKANSPFDSVNAKYLAIGTLDLGGKWYEIDVQGSIRKKINELCFDVNQSLQAARRAAGNDEKPEWSDNQTPVLQDETTWLKIPANAKVFSMDGREVTPAQQRNQWSDYLSTGFYVVQFEHTDGQWLSRKIFFTQPQ